MAVDVLGYLKHTKNTLIGNPSAKLALKRTREPEGPLLASIVSYVNYTAITDEEAASSSFKDPLATQIRIEAANVVVSLAHGPREVLYGLLEADALSAVLNALAALSEHEPVSLKIAVVRAFRALCVAVADCAGPSLWGLGEEYLEYRSETRSTLDYVFQAEALDVYLPLLESPTPMIKLYIAQLLAFAVRVPKHRVVVTDWLPPAEKVKESKGKRGWEVSALIDANSPGRQGGWVMRSLAAMLRSKDFALQEVGLYATASLVKDNPNIALVLSKPASEQKTTQSVLSIASDLTKDRRSEVRLAACLCVTNILRSTNSNHDRRLPSTIIHVLIAVISNSSESPVNRTKACHILSWFVADDTERCTDAWKSGALDRLADLINLTTPRTKPQEWEDGEAVGISRMREAALTAVAALAMLDNDIRNEVTGKFSLLPLISVCLEHPNAGVRYGACQCVRALGRSIRVLRTNLLDSGVGLTLCEIVENRNEDRRVTTIALNGLCNLVNDFSPLRQTIMDRGMVVRISELARAQEDALRVSALWAIKNLLNKASSSDKESIMKQIGWDYLRSCLVDSKEDVQEQALNILVNIASTPEDIDILFQNFTGDDLVKILAEELDSPSEEVVCQAVKVVSNISNGHTQRDFIVSNPRMLSTLRTCLVHHRTEIRHASISCIETLAHTHPFEMKEAGIDETLRHILRESFTSLHSTLENEARRRMSVNASTILGSDGGSELRELVQNALRAIEG